MIKVIKKSIGKELQTLWELMPDDTARGGNEAMYATQIEPKIKRAIITSHITLAKEKIKELEGENKQATFKDGIDVLLVGYNKCIEDQITKQKQFIKELTELL